MIEFDVFADIDEQSSTILERKYVKTNMRT